MKNLLKSALIISGTELALIVVGILRSKYLAVTIGPEGLGLYGLLSSFFIILTGFSGGWFGLAYIKFIAEYHQKNKPREIKIIHNSAFTIICISVVVIVCSLALFKRVVINQFLSKDVLDFHYAVFAAIFVINSFKSLYEYYLNAVLLAAKTARSRMLTTAFEFVSIVVLIYFFKVQGFFISLLLSSLISLIIFKLATKKLIQQSFDPKSLAKPESVTFLKYGSFNIFLILLNYVSQYYYRVLIISNLNLAFVGLFQAINSLMTYVGIFNKGSNYTYVPTMGQSLTIDERNSILNSYLKLNVPIGLLVASVAILFIDTLIPLFYSNKFSSISSFSHWFILAQFTYIYVIAFQSIIVGMNNYRIHTIVVICTNIIWLVVPYLLIKTEGVGGIAFGMIAASSWSVIFNFTYLKINFKVALQRQVLVSMLFSCLLLLTSIYLKNSFIIYKLAFILAEILFVWLLIESSIKQDILVKIKQLVNKPDGLK